jgi:glycosyltransferase Alg8
VPLALALLVAALMLSHLVGDLVTWVSRRLEILLVLGGIASWRWGWFVLQSLRAILYRYRVYPRLRREAERAVRAFGPVPELTILAVTYKEKPWITRAVFQSLFREIYSLQGLTRPAKVLVVTGCREDDKAIRQIYDEHYPVENPINSRPGRPELVLMRDATGKRPALSGALRQISAANPHPDGVVVLMDGDSILQSGLLNKVLPMFRIKPAVAAVTTNEDGWVKGPRWFAEWISLRFGLRHRSMCSVALSGRLLCLTGRLSAFRASVATDPTFRAQIEHDSIHHWLWGTFDMLSGDDKSTWYWLAARGHRMLYVPDARATTVEVVEGSAVARALANIRRWSGNSLRHSWRAFKIGPRRLGWFCWYSLLDQRLAIWTVLVGPLFALLALGSGAVELAAGYLLWLLLSRLAHAAISWRHGRRLSAFYPPLQILSDWSIALTKVWILFHPAKQAWLNRGARILDTTRGGAFYRVRTIAAHYLYGFSCAATAILVGVYTGFLAPVREWPLYLRAGAGSGGPVALPEAARGRPVLMFGQQSGGDTGPASDSSVFAEAKAPVRAAALTEQSWLRPKPSALLSDVPVTLLDQTNSLFATMPFSSAETVR